MKKLLLATALTLASMSANAGIVSTAGGVTVIESSGTQPGDINFDMTVAFTQWWTSPGNSSATNALLSTNTFEASPTGLNGAEIAELVGVGSFSSFNGTVDDAISFAVTNTAICQGCQLSFAFGGFIRTYDANAAVPVTFDTDGAWLNIYLDYDTSSILDSRNIYNDQTVATANEEVAKAVNGDLWLQLDILNFEFDPDDDDIINGNPNASGEVAFLGDVVGGIAQENFVNDLFGMSFDADAYGFSATFLNCDPKRQAFCDNTNSIYIDDYSNRGSGNVQARVVSEPGAIALFSLGLIGLGLSARRRMNK
jgi:hypothetical protein